MIARKKGLKGKLDKAFSLWIRKRDNWTCRRCGMRYTPFSRGYHAAHMKGRRNETLRWDEKNVFGLDYGCHSFLDQHADAKVYWYVSQFGQAAWDELIVKSRKLSHFKDYQIELMLEMYK